MSESPTYNSWRAMRERCDNENNTHYDIYGGRGITYPSEWSDFSNFLADMGERPDGMTLDRIDVNKNYSKENCRWATVSEQNFNTNLRKDNKTGYKGAGLKGDHYFVTYRSIHVARGLTLEEAVQIRKEYEDGTRKLTDNQLEKIRHKAESKRKRSCIDYKSC